MTTGIENDEDAPVRSNAFREQQERDYEVMFGKTMTTETSTARVAPQTPKKYACLLCGHVTTQTTNHYGHTYSSGHLNTCPKCPPWAKYSEFGGHTEWECLERPPSVQAE